MFNIPSRTMKEIYYNDDVWHYCIFLSERNTTNNKYGVTEDIGMILERPSQNTATKL